MFSYEYARPAITVDIIVCDSGGQHIALIKRKNEPFKDCWALPGGFVEMDETLKAAAVRELFEETGLKVSECDLEFVGIYDRVNRDPRERVISVAFSCDVDETEQTIVAKDDAIEVKWVDTDEVFTTNLAFDHSRIIDEAFSL